MRLVGLSASLVAASASMLLSACGDGSTAADDRGAQALSLQPAPDAKPVELRPGVVAAVAAGEVTRREFRRAYAARARALGRRGGTRAQRHRVHVALARATMTDLIQSKAIAQRAKTAGVSVSTAQVDAALERSREAFDSPAQWRQFLKRTHQTESQVRGRLRLELLNRRLHARRSATAAASAADAAALARRLTRARTECRPGYVVALCSNSPSKPTEAPR